MDVTVRFVPKNRSNTPRRAFFGQARSEGIGALRPDQGSARAAMGILASQGVQAISTLGERLETQLSPGSVSSRFGVDLVEKKVPENVATTAEKHTYLAPKGELVVPDELRDEVEFAYIPRPVEFYGASFIAPQQDVFHLSLEQVRMALQAARCHRRGWTGKGIKVAMADSGFFPHPYFARNGYSLIPTASPGSGDPSIDDSGHGTGEAANIFAMAPDCTVFGVKHGNTAAATLETCIDLKPQIMTNSWGWSVDTQTKTQLKQRDPNFFNEMVDIETVLLEAVAAGIAVFFSAGNGHLAFPACMKEVIAVGGVSVDASGALQASNYASSFRSKLYPGRRVPDFCGIVGRSATAPMPGHIMLPVPPGSELDGENFDPVKKGGGWGIFSGTSAASPQAAGIAALVAAIDTQLSPAQLRSVLQATTTDVAKGKTALGDTAKVGKDLATGSGFMDAFGACEMAATA